MAQKTRVVLIDDLDGGEAHESVSFGVDGVEYDIDLSTANASKLRGVLDSFVSSARRVGRTKSSRRPASAVARKPVTAWRDDIARTPEMNKAIRGWAKDNGIPVSDRGRIAADVLDQYITAHPGL